MLYLFNFNTGKITPTTKENIDGIIENDPKTFKDDYGFIYVVSRPFRFADTPEHYIVPRPYEYVFEIPEGCFEEIIGHIGNLLDEHEHPEVPSDVFKYLEHVYQQLLLHVTEGAEYEKNH